MHDPWLRGSGSGAADLGTGRMSARAIEGARRALQKGQPLHLTTYAPVTVG